MIVLTLFNTVIVLDAELCRLLNASITCLYALARRPASAIEKLFTFSLSVFETGLKSFKFQFKLLILNFKFALLKLNFVGVLNSCVYQRKSCVRTISFLIDDRNVLSESLLCVF